MRTKFVFILIVIINAANLISAQEAAAQNDFVVIKNKLKKWAESFNQRDLNKLKEIYAEDFLASYPNQPNQDLNLTMESFNHLFQNTFLEMKMSFKVLEIEASGDLAYVRLDQVSEVKPKIAKKPQYGQDTGIQIWKKQANGDWKMSRSVMFPLSVSPNKN